MKRALVTGVSSGIGNAIAKMLSDDGYQIFGLSRRSLGFKPITNLINLECDFRDFKNIKPCISKILESGPLDVVVHAAGVGHFAPHEELKSESISDMVAVNITAPLVITKQTLKSLKETQGVYIFVGSISGRKVGPFGGAYAATKAAMHTFSDYLFEEVRRSGVRVCTVIPDIVKTPFFDRLSFYEGESSDTFVTPECVASAVRGVMNQRDGTAITEIIIRPQRHELRKRARRE